MADPINSITKKQSSVYILGLPPLPRGQSIFADGVAGYYLSLEAAYANFFSKAQSDLRYLQLIGGILTGDLSLKLNSLNNPRSIYFKNFAGSNIGALTVSPDDVSLWRYIPGEIPVDSATNYALVLGQNFFGLNVDFGSPGSPNSLLQAKYGIKKNGAIGAEIDNVNLNSGYYTWTIPGKFIFRKAANDNFGAFDFSGALPIISLMGDNQKGYFLGDTVDGGVFNDYVLTNKLYVKNNFLQLNPVDNQSGNYNSNSIELRNGIWKFSLTDGTSTNKSVTFNFADGDDLQIDLIDAKTTLGQMTGGTWTNLPSGPGAISYSESSEKFAQIGHVKNVFPKYDAIVKNGTVNNNLNEFNTVRAAVLAGKSNIYINSGTYTASSFWPNSNTVVPDRLIISGPERNKAIIEGYANFYFGSTAIPFVKFENIRFKTSISETTDDSLIKFHNGTKYIAIDDTVEFANCDFINSSNSNSRCVGVSNVFTGHGHIDVLKFNNCYFEFCKIGVSTVLADGSNSYEPWVFAAGENMGYYRRIYEGCSYWDNSVEGCVYSNMQFPTLVKNCSFSLGDSTTSRIALKFYTISVVDESRIDIQDNTFIMNSSTNVSPHVALYTLYGNNGSGETYGGGYFTMTGNKFNNISNANYSFIVQGTIGGGGQTGSEYHDMIFTSNVLKNFAQNGSETSYTGFKGNDGFKLRVGSSVNFGLSGTNINASSGATSGATFGAALDKTNITK